MADAHSRPPRHERAPDPLLPPGLRRPRRAGRDAESFHGADGLPRLRVVPRRRRPDRDRPPRLGRAARPDSCSQLRRRLPRHRRSRASDPLRARLSGNRLRRSGCHGRQDVLHVVPRTARTPHVGGHPRARPRRNVAFRGAHADPPQPARTRHERRTRGDRGLESRARESPRPRGAGVVLSVRALREARSSGLPRRRAFKPPFPASPASTTVGPTGSPFVAGRSTPGTACSTSEPSSGEATTPHPRSAPSTGDFATAPVSASCSS